MSNTWHNWAGDQICVPSVIKRPTSEAELVEIVAGAAQKGEPVRAVGTGHSFTDCACTDGVMIDMTGLQRVIDVDTTQTPRVRLSVQIGLFNSQYLDGSERCSTPTSVSEGDPRFEPTAMTPGTEDHFTALCIDGSVKKVRS